MRGTLPVEDDSGRTVENAYARLLRKHVDGQAKISALRKALAARTDFAVAESFLILDRERRKTVDVEALCGFMASQSYMISAEDAFSIIRAFDRDGDGRWNILEYICMLVPEERQAGDESKASFADHNKGTRSAEDERFALENAVGEAVRMQLEHLRKIEQCKQTLTKCADFIYPTLFADIDSDRDGRLGPEELLDFLNRIRKNCPGWDLPLVQQLIARLDEDRDGKLSFSEFYECVVPERGDMAADLTDRADTARSVTVAQKCNRFRRRPC